MGCQFFCFAPVSAAQLDMTAPSTGLDGSSTKRRIPMCALPSSLKTVSLMKDSFAMLMARGSSKDAQSILKEKREDRPDLGLSGRHAAIWCIRQHVQRQNAPANYSVHGKRLCFQ